MSGDCNNNITTTTNNNNNEINNYKILKNKGSSGSDCISFCGRQNTEDKAANPEIQNSKDKDESDRVKNLCKIALPHICLYVMLCLYLLVGAWAFARIEHRAERLEQSKRLIQIENIYEEITSTVVEECSPLNNDNTTKHFDLGLLREGIYSSLSHLSQFFEGPKFKISATEEPVLDKVLPPKWDAMSSTLYALSILTTTGYASATSMTPFGQWLSIAYGLLGIPLTVLAAVDIGRFLSDVVLAIYDRILRAFYRLRKLCCQMRRRRTGPVTLQNIKTNLAFNTPKTSIANRKRQKQQLIVSALPTKNNKKRKTNESETNGEETKRRLPLSVNAAILLLFCMLGGWVYMAADGSGHTFIEGFFVTFNLVANLTMSEMPTHISYLMTLIYIFVFVFFGLAVLSMCADLAASELKWMFLKIHYFGRKINWAKRRANKRKQEQMEMEVKELLLLIDQIRAKYPEKEDISSLDILKYVQELNADKSFGGSWSHRTFNLWLLQHQRRNTMAFTPQSFEALKFADEMDQEEEQLLNSTVNALLINWRRQKRRGEQNTFIPLLPFGV